MFQIEFDLRSDVDLSSEEVKETTTKKSKTYEIDVLWNEKIEMLTEFKEKYGHCEVPETSSYLGKFVKVQRAIYATGRMREDRIVELNKMGFSWKASAPLNLLLIVYENKGHCHVEPSDPKLGPYVSSLRKRKRSTRERRNITEEEKNSLDSIGFHWEEN